MSYRYKYKKFSEELIAYFPWYAPDRTENDASDNSIVAFVFVAAVTFLQSRYLATIGNTHIEKQTDGKDL
jgi:hypothetical protein